MENDQIINITPGDGTREIIIRHGQAAQIHDALKLHLVGNIQAPRALYDIRKKIPDYFSPERTHVIVDRTAGTMILVQNDRDVFGATVTGKLEQTDEFKTFGLNTGKTYAPDELAKLLKRNRAYISSGADDLAAIISDLQNFKAEFVSNVEKSKDERGNQSNLFVVAVKSNVPTKFKLSLPIYKGGMVERFEVEIHLNVRNGQAVECFLESPEANDLLITKRDEIINDELSDFDADGIPVIEK